MRIRSVIAVKIRKITAEDLPRAAELYELAKGALKAQGVDQWQDGSPNIETAREDMKNGVGYVLEDDTGEVIATACLAFGREPTYDEIFGGEWSAKPECYGFLHRIAVAPSAKGKGAAGLMFDKLKRMAHERGVNVLRGDTHRDNKPMQRVMEKNGLAYRGVIYLEDGSERLAYEIILNN